ncbi:unnamed protein product [Hymenolepis diminuta]|uniref:Uncharacterized protein n=1 Tax=Hymenolepis diminuta TaxID=6216 RepID=A0A0R3SN00_HYMDI|nr:unnamed protein product [Hymenolepis diminuta]
MSGLVYLINSIDVAPIDLTSSHGGTVANEFTGVTHMSAGDADGSSFPRHGTRIRPHFTSYSGSMMANGRFRSRRRGAVAPKIPISWRCCYHRDWLVGEVAARTATKMVTKKASAENLL